jgi:hypothetical protein
MHVFHMSREAKQVPAPLGGSYIRNEAKARAFAY